jgi:hypothetical protein
MKVRFSLLRGVCQTPAAAAGFEVASVEHYVVARRSA